MTQRIDFSWGEHGRRNIAMVASARRPRRTADAVSRAAKRGIAPGRPVIRWAPARQARIGRAASWRRGTQTCAVAWKARSSHQLSYGVLNRDALPRTSREQPSELGVFCRVLSPCTVIYPTLRRSQNPINKNLAATQCPTCQVQVPQPHASRRNFSQAA